MRINPFILLFSGLLPTCARVIQALVFYHNSDWWTWLFCSSIPLIWAAFYAANKLRLFSITGIIWAGLVAIHSILIYYKLREYYQLGMGDEIADIKAGFLMNSLQFILPSGFILVAYHYYFFVAPLNFLKKNPFTAKIQKARQSGDEPEIRRAITCSALYHPVCRAYYEKIIDLSDLRFRFNDIPGIVEEAAAEIERAIA